MVVSDSRLGQYPLYPTSLPGPISFSGVGEKGPGNDVALTLKKGEFTKAPIIIYRLGGGGFWGGPHGFQEERIRKPIEYNGGW